METLDYLVAKGLIDSNGLVVPSKNPFKIVKSGVIMQPRTHLGIPYDIVISWLQKAIRCGDYQSALFCAYQVVQLDTHQLNQSQNTMFRSHLLNRLITIMSEDVGVAQNIVLEISDRYWKLYHLTVSEEFLAQTLCEMIWILAHAQKSRYTDWLIHSYQLGLGDKVSGEDPLYKKITEVLPGDKESEAISLLNFDSLEVQALYQLYTHRGREYGILYLIHALLLSLDSDFLSQEANNNSDNNSNNNLLQGFQFTIEDWIANEELVNVKPIPNSVIDKHTRWGRTYLGRNMYYFMTVSSHLENHINIGSEAQIKDTMIDYYKKQEKIGLPSQVYNNRPYQSQLIESVLQELNNNESNDNNPVNENQNENQNKIKIKINKTLFKKKYKTVCLNMATGTGKTRTSYCIIKEYLTKDPSQWVMMVFPTLDILDQTLQVWEDMIKAETDPLFQRVIVGILASKHYNYPKHQFNYEFIDDVEGIQRFINYPTNLVGQKVIFSTYASLSRKNYQLNKLISLTIYDEGHHLTEKTQLPGHKVILTATPKANIYYDTTLRYTIGDGIRDGFLTPFKVCIIDTSQVPTDQIDNRILNYICRHSKKIICYSYRNSVSKELYQTFTNPNKYYIDCHLSNRKEILDQFKEDNRAIIFNCSIMGEGVDIPDCDAIYLNSGRKSYTALVQSVGRCLRPTPNKSLATIYLQKDKDINQRLMTIQQIGWEPEIISTVL